MSVVYKGLGPFSVFCFLCCSYPQPLPLSQRDIWLFCLVHIASFTSSSWALSSLESSNPIGAGHPTRPSAAAEPPSELTPHHTVVLGVWVNPCHLSGGFLKLGVGDGASEPGAQKLFNHVGSLKLHSCTAECLFWNSGWQPTVRGLSWTKRPLPCPRQEGWLTSRQWRQKWVARSMFGTVSCVDL